MGKPSESAAQQQLDQQQSKLLQQQQDEYNKQVKLSQSSQLDFIQRLQSQSGTSSGISQLPGSTGGVTTGSGTGFPSGLFQGSSTIG